MIKQCSRVALIASSLVLAAAVPAHAAELPDEPVTVQLKGEPELALAWGGDGAVIASEGDLWSFRPVEALVEVGEVLIVHEDGGQCLSPSESGPPEQAPLELVDCADAVAWAAVFDDVASNQDWRFTDPEGRFLGLAPGVDPADGAPVVAEAVLGTSSVHDQEWLFEAAPEETPPPEETSPEAPSEVAQPKLPTTGAGFAAGAAGAVAAIGAGAGLLMWLRRRSLRTNW